MNIMKKTITICGSMQFENEMKKLKIVLEENDWLVLTPEMSEKSESYVKLPESEKKKQKKLFITNHFNRIKQSNAILVANYEKKGIGGYIGSNTLMEIGVAHALDKKIYILHALDPQPCSEEVETLATTILLGNIETLS